MKNIQNKITAGILSACIALALSAGAVSEMVCAAENASQISFCSLSYNGKVGVNIAVTPDKTVDTVAFDNENDCTFDVVLSEDSAEIYGGTYSVYTYYLPASNLPDSITVTINGIPETLSAADATKAVAESDEFNDYVKMIAASLLDYGNAAKSYFAGENTIYGGSVISEDNMRYDIESTANILSTNIPSADGFEYLGSSLILKSSPVYRVYYRTDENASIDGFFTDNSGNILTFTRRTKDYGFIEFGFDSIFEMGLDYTFFAGNYKSTFCPIEYAAVFALKGDDVNLQNLCLSIIQFYITVLSYSEA